jgi:hypothetical protein
MSDALTLVEVKPGVMFSLASLKEFLPDTETALFFGKLYKLDAYQLGNLLSRLFNSSVFQALTRDDGTHSHELQDYALALGYDEQIEMGAISFKDDTVQGELLPELWESLEVDIAKAIDDVMLKVKDVVAHMPGKEGRMLFQSLMQVNAKRPVLGDYKARVQHDPQLPNLVVFDVSGSMTEATVETIASSVVSMSYMANAHLAIVSDTATHWGPGEFDTDAVLSRAEYSGTHYETLAPLFDNEAWGVVVCIADYDSSRAAESAFAKVNGSIELLLDISLVNRPTYLAQVLEPLAKETKPLLIAADYYCCMGNY